MSKSSPNTGKVMELNNFDRCYKSFSKESLTFKQGDTFWGCFDVHQIIFFCSIDKKSKHTLVNFYNTITAKANISDLYYSLIMK